MRGDNHVLALTTTTDEVTGETKPLFHFPVQICKATDDKEPGFDIAAPSGAPRKQAWIDTATGELVEDADCLRGLRCGDEFKTIDPDAIKAIQDSTKISMMTALGVVDLDTVPFDRATGIYFVQSPAQGGSPKGYRLVYEALKPSGKGKTARPAKGIVVKRTPRSRQVLGVIYADTNVGCLMMVQLRFATTIKAPDEQILAPQLAQVEEVQIDKARAVIDALSDGTEVIAAASDDAIALRQELIEKALSGEAIIAPTPVAESVEADSLEAQLEASLAAV